jgi:hypothetical protein
MGPRMMCTDCFRTAHADTVLEGSDLVEMLGWCCFAVPGLLYCWWRHALRIKVCSFCGGHELVREARAAAARLPWQASPFRGPRVWNASGPVRWPRALATPRERLRHGGVAAALVGAFLGSLALAALDLAAHSGIVAAACAIAFLGSAWVAFQVVRVSRMRATLPGCKAWDQHGRPLRIERVF